MLTQLIAPPSPSQNLSPLLRSRNLIAVVRNLFSSGVPLGEINAPLDALLQNLENHLMHHRGNDFYEESVFANPWLTRASEALRQQQMEVETSLHQLKTSLQRGSQSHVPASDLRENFEHFIEIFYEHEVATQMFVQCGSGPY